MADSRTEKRKIHWEKTRRLTFIVLAIWFVFGLVLPYFANALNSMSFLGFPLGYYFPVQGSLIVFVVMIVVHNMLQDGIDDEYGSGEE